MACQFGKPFLLVPNGQDAKNTSQRALARKAPKPFGPFRLNNQMALLGVKHDSYFQIVQNLLVQKLPSQ